MNKRKVIISQHKIYTENGVEFSKDLGTGTADQTRCTGGVSLVHDCQTMIFPGKGIP